MLVLDDYHSIHDEAVHSLLAALIRDQPRQVHLVLASRTDPPLSLASLRAGRQMLDIRAGDLCFTSDEARAFLEQTVGVTLPADIVSLLEERTEGWVVGLRLAALSMRGLPDHAAFVQSFRGTHRDLMDYLVAEVLARQPQHVQEFLLRTSILDRLCAPLCDAVCTAMPDTACAGTAGTVGSSVGSDVILDELERANLFLVPLDHERHWYRYHHLFQDSLRHKLRTQVDADELASMYKRASTWSASNGFTEEALDYSLTADDVEGAAQLVEDCRHDLLNREDRPTLERFLKRLPEEIVRGRPALLVARAWVLQSKYQIAGIRPLLQEAEAWLSIDASTWPESEAQSLRGEIDALWSVVWYIQAEGQRALEHALGALERLPIAHAFARSMAMIIVAMAYQMTGQTRAATRTLGESLAAAGTQPDTIIARVLISQIYVHMLSGCFHQAEPVLHQTLQLARKKGLTISLVVAHWQLGRINYEWNRLEAARQHFSAVFELRYGGQFIMVHDSMMALALTYQAQGTAEKANDTLAALRSFSLEVGITDRLHEIDSFEARLAVQRGDLLQTTHWAETVHLDRPTVTVIFLELLIFTKARVLIARGTDASLREAIQLLQALLAQTESTHNTYHQIGILAHLALAYQAQGQSGDALEVIERSVRLAQPGRFIRTFVDLGSPMAGLLYQLVERETLPAHINRHIRRMLAAFPKAEGEDAKVRDIREKARVELIEPLTERESEILLFLSRELRSKEIARELSISPLTVKRHTVNLYAKLDVHSRKEAVARARSLGILPLD
jgi:LuxR family maltose regulon positive regulatory protein